jgi:hypothetical protein
MPFDPLAIVQHRIRRLEILLDIARDAETCAGIYAKAILARALMERLLDDQVAEASTPGFLLIVALYYHEDLKLLRRLLYDVTETAERRELEEKIALTAGWKEASEAEAEALAAQELEHATRIYQALKGNPSVESRARAVYSKKEYSAFYQDYSALSQFVHGGHREALLVTQERGDVSAAVLPTINQAIQRVAESARASLATLHGSPAPAQHQKFGPIDYDHELEFRRISPGNWLQADLPRYFPGSRPDEWVTAMLVPRLEPQVPREIVQLFEAARGAMIYSWFFYPLATLAVEQNHRIMEAAAKLRAAQVGRPAKRLADAILSLQSVGIITAENFGKWEATRKSRNSSSHPERQEIWDPGMAAEIFRSSADLINRLFQRKPEEENGEPRA